MGRDVRQIARVTLAEITHEWSFPPGGNVLYKSLDSSAFVPDAALPPASMQAGLRRNDGEGNRHGLIIPLATAAQQRDT